VGWTLGDRDRDRDRDRELVADDPSGRPGCGQKRGFELRFEDQLFRPLWVARIAG
jgi:hypothetical protein